MGKKKHGGNGGGPEMETETDGTTTEVSETTEEALAQPEGTEGTSQAGTEGAPTPTDKEQSYTEKMMKKLGLESKSAEPDRDQLKGVTPPCIGDTVHYVLPHGNTRGAHRPLQITSLIVASRNFVNGVVTLEDGDNYLHDTHAFVAEIAYGPEGTVNTWHYPEEAVKARQEANEAEDKA